MREQEKLQTILGKVKYLLANEKSKPEEILVLSFTKASKTEMAERLEKEVKNKIPVFTFHALGLSIVEDVEKTKSTICDEDKQKKNH